MASRIPTRAEYLAMIGEADQDAEDQELPADTRRALGRLAGDQLHQKDTKLSRKKRLVRNPQPKTSRKTPSGRCEASQPSRETVWRAVREQGFERSGYRCEKCGVHRRHAFGGVLDGHHRKRRGIGRDELVNCAVLCRVCHEWVHKHPEAATEMGYIVPAQEEPAVKPMRLPDGRRVLLTDAACYGQGA